MEKRLKVLEEMLDSFLEVGDGEGAIVKGKEGGTEGGVRLCEGELEKRK
jgi:hypothetical protein